LRRKIAVVTIRPVGENVLLSGTQGEDAFAVKRDAASSGALEQTSPVLEFLAGTGEVTVGRS